MENETSHQGPACLRGKRPGNRLMERGMARIDQAIELAAPPAWDEPDLDLEGGRDCADRVHR